ncbi:hypothetical protein T439DRAFT_354477 [Meredithblackwellia eburnea MCA 4105]
MASAERPPRTGIGLGHSTQDPVVGRTGGGGYGKESSEQDKFLNQAKTIEITAEDRQEGYDADLLNLRPRTGESEAVERAKSPAPTPSDAEKGQAGNGGTSQRVNMAEGTYESRNKPSDADTRQSGRSREGGRSHRSRRQKKKAVVWWMRTSSIILFVLVLALVGAGVGLGVGLGLKKNSKSGGSDSSVDNTSISGIILSTSSSEGNNIPGIIQTSSAAPALGTAVGENSVSFNAVSTTAHPRASQES